MHEISQHWAILVTVVVAVGVGLAAGGVVVHGEVRVMHACRPWQAWQQQARRGHWLGESVRRRHQERAGCKEQPPTTESLQIACLHMGEHAAVAVVAAAAGDVPGDQQHLLAEMALRMESC